MGESNYWGKVANIILLAFIISVLLLVLSSSLASTSASTTTPIPSDPVAGNFTQTILPSDSPFPTPPAYPGQRPYGMQMLQSLSYMSKVFTQQQQEQIRIMMLNNTIPFTAESNYPMPVTPSAATSNPAETGTSRTPQPTSSLPSTISPHPIPTNAPSPAFAPIPTNPSSNVLSETVYGLSALTLISFVVLAVYMKQKPHKKKR